MNIDQVKAQIKETVFQCAQIPADKIGDNVDLKNDLDLDSLTLLEVAITLDQTFETEFSDEELGEMSNLEQTARMIIERVEQKAQGNQA